MTDDMLDRVIYLDADSGKMLEGDFPQKDPDELREKMTIKARVRGKGVFWYRIVRLDREYYTRAYLKRVYIHYTDIIKLLIIIVLGKIVLQSYADFFWAWW